MTAPQPADPSQPLDVLVLGAGLSGIDAAYRVAERCPGATYAVLERREQLGGTWDLFRYPGVRSDSDFFTLSLPFRPWEGDDAIVSGESILDYLRTTADELGITPHIRFGTRVRRLVWSSRDALWTAQTETDEGPRTFRARFVIGCTGYYSYDQPFEAEIPGLEEFGGEVLHPQFWPHDFDHAGKRVVVVGSGATAVTLVPALAESGAEHVVMLQRTPTYVIAQPSHDPLADLARKLLPARQAHSLVRAKNIALQVAFFQACRRAPRLMRSVFRKGAIAQTGSAELVDEHFNPPYAPWDQRVCISPGGDLFRAIRHQKASVVTDTIERVTEDGVLTSSGEHVRADVIVTATGLNLEILGGVAVEVDGEDVDVSQRFTYRGVMLSGVPNLAVCLGYINLSWTVRADLSNLFVTRVINRLRSGDHDWVVPVADGEEATGPLLDMDSGYLRRSAHLQPRAGRGQPWLMVQNAYLDAWATRRADLSDLVYGTAQGAASPVVELPRAASS